VAETSPDRDPRVRRRWWLGAAVAVIVLAGVAAALIANAVNSPTTSAGGSTAAATCQVPTIADKVLPSVVTIKATGSAGGGGTGSGEVIRPDGHMLTNNHVISIAAHGGAVHVQFIGGQEKPATIVGRDPLTDLAVLKVQPGSELKVIALGSSDSVRVGQSVVALGSPLGLTGTVTAGIVSALDRTIQVPGENDRSALLVSAVQTDAAINPGNSGGAMVNCDGKLIGVPTAGATVPSPSGESSGGSIGLGFAIPIDLATSIADQIISTGRVTHAFFGLETVPVQAGEAPGTGAAEGLFVVSVTPGGPAAQAGLAGGDVITSIDGEPARSNIQLEKLTVTKRAGDVVSVDYKRAGQSLHANITLGAQP
jgi:putative serine protease PepD